MGSFSIAHWLLVIAVIAIVFGPKKFAEAGKGLGEGLRNFKKGLKEEPEPEAPRQLDSGDKQA
jgi:sec-independent protein translocase protein TatA